MKAEWCPAGKVPVLHDGPLVLWDSLAICEYVADKVADVVSATLADAAFWPPRRAPPRRGTGDERGDAQRILDAPAHHADELPASGAGVRAGLRHPRRHRPAGGSVRDGAVAKRLAGRIGGRRTVLRIGPAAAVAPGCSVPTPSPMPCSPRSPRAFAPTGCRLPRATRAWIEATLDDPPMREWYAAAAAEPEVIERSEVPDRDPAERGPAESTDFGRALTPMSLPVPIAGARRLDDVAAELTTRYRQGVRCSHVVPFPCREAAFPRGRSR